MAKGEGIFLFILIATGLLMFGCIFGGGSGQPPLDTVKYVDLERYSGEWYEIARYPNRFQRDCPASKATYSLLASGKVKVLNECWDPGYREVLRSVNGKARVVDRESNAKLKVTFFWPFSGDYWIIDLGRDYEYAVVGHPTRRYLWILSRSPEMGDDLYRRIIDNLKKLGYDPARLIGRKQEGEGYES